MVRRSVSERILREMQEIRYRLDDIEKAITTWKPAPLDVQETKLLSLPDNLRKTYLAVVSKGECNAIQTSNVTGRSRAIESSYLNRLTQMGWLTKRRNKKSFFFYPVSGEMPIRTDRENEIPMTPQYSESAYNMEIENRKKQVGSKIIRVRHLSTDYDGTISPKRMAKSESHIPLETRVLLSHISKSLPISIISMKDMHFITAKTPFAHAWAAIGGLETKIGKRTLKNQSVVSKLPNISKALEYARTETSATGIRIEEKQDSEGQTIAFGVNWGQTKDQELSEQVADRIIAYSSVLGLQILRYKGQPFVDVYPIIPDKGQALQELLSEITVRKGVMYLGDSETDNAAFKNPLVSVSIGVIHDESQLKDLECDYLLRFEDVPYFLKTLITESFQFSSSFPMIKTNPFRRPTLNPWGKP